MRSLDLSRRGFVGAAASVTALAAVTPAFAVPARRLHGDGIHDDTEALEHLLQGGAVTVVSDRVTAELSDGTVRLFNAKFRTRRPLRMAHGLNLYAANCTFIVGDGPAVPYPVLTKGEQRFA